MIDSVRGALNAAEVRLAASVASPRADAEILLRHVLQCSRSELYSGSINLDPEQTDQYELLVHRRADGTPLQHLTGVQSFRRLQLEVHPEVLIPRPETELLVEHALFCIQAIPNPMVVDVGTGSGAVGLSIAFERPDARVIALDTSVAALELAGRNAEALELDNVTFLRSDLLAEVPPTVAIDMVVSNPPYLTEAEISEAPVEVCAYEPRGALYGGPSGAEVSLRLISEAARLLNPGGWIVMETSPLIAFRLSEAMSAVFTDISVISDLTSTDRFVRGRKK